MMATTYGISLRGYAAAYMLVGLIIGISVNTTQAASFVAVDSEGFESPDYDLAALEGQLATTLDGAGTAQWVQSPLAGTSTAFVQDSVFASGSQAVKVDRAANSDDRWAVPVAGFPAERFICIEWDMMVEQTITSTGFGPFFGIEAYDDDAATIGLLGSLGVDAATGDVLYQEQDTGFFVETGTFVNFGAWNSFSIILDFQEDEYYTFMDGIFLGTTGFVDGSFGLDQFTDADITAIAAAGDPISQALTGTAYFDNYIVTETDINKIPEPTTLALLAIALAAGLVNKRA